jgi:uncharacterized membrane protein YdjX (TVP38/TMEM64 family)
MFLKKIYEKNFFYNNSKFLIFLFFIILSLLFFFYNDQIFKFLSSKINSYIFLKENYYIYFVLIYFFINWLATTLLLPGLILAFFSGLIFGLKEGMIINILSTTCGAITIFWLFRKFSKDFIKKNFLKNNSNLASFFKKDRTLLFIIARFLGFPPIQLLNIIPAYLGMSLLRFSLIVFFAQPLIKIYIIFLASTANLGFMTTINVAKYDINNYLFYLITIVIFIMLLNNFFKKWIIKKIN